MLNFYASFAGLAGALLGIVHAILFYNGNKRLHDVQLEKERSLLHGIGVSFLRYILLFACFWILFLKFKLNIYYGMGGFFVAYWIVLLKKTKIRELYKGQE